MKDYAWLKAGIAAGALALFLNAASVIPPLACLLCPISCVSWFLLPAGAGFLAAHWAKLGRNQFNEALTQGALAGVTLGVISGVTSIISNVISSLIWDTTRTYYSFLENDSSRWVDLASVPSGLAGTVLCGSFVCLFIIFLDVIIAALTSVIKVAFSNK